MKLHIFRFIHVFCLFIFCFSGITSPVLANTSREHLAADVSFSNIVSEPVVPPVSEPLSNERLSLIDGYGGVSKAIAVDERGYAYFGVGPRLYVVDSHSHPGKIGNVLNTNALWSEITGVEVQDKKVFISLADPGMVIFDISEPMNPRQVGAFSTQYSVNDFIVSGNYLYLLNNAFLTIVNISNPAYPKQVNQLSDINGFSLTKWNDYIVVGGDNYAKFIFVQDPTQISDADIFGGIIDNFSGDNLNVIGNYLYGTAWGKITVLNIQDIRHPYLINSVILSGGYIRKMQIINDEAYILFEDTGFCIVDVPDPYHISNQCRVQVNEPHDEWNYDYSKIGDSYIVTTNHGLSLRSASTLAELDHYLISPGVMYDLTYDDQNIYTGGQDGIWKMPFSEPNQWSLIPIESPVYSIKYTRKMDVPYLIIDSGNGKLKSASIENPEAFQFSDDLSLGGGIEDFKVLGSRLYVITNSPSRFIVIDVTDPMAMGILSQTDIVDVGGLTNIEVVENNDQSVSAYIGCERSLLLYNVRISTGEISKVASLTSSYVNSLVVLKGIAVYLLNSQGMMILDPADLSIVKEIPMENPPLEATLDKDNHLWLINLNIHDSHRNILNIYDISQADSPELKKTASISAQLWNLQFKPDGTFLVNGLDTGILNYDFRASNLVYLPLIVR